MFTLVDPSGGGKFRGEEWTGTLPIHTNGNLTLRLYAFKEEYDVLPGSSTGTGWAVALG